MKRSRRQLAGVALLLGASLGLAGCFDFEVTKEVTGGTSQGPFEVAISCPSSVIGTTDTLTFNGPGTETSLEFASDVAATCTITETATAGASEVSLACGQPLPAGVTCNSTPAGLQVAGIEGTLEGVTIPISVVNDFTPPPTTPPGDPGAPPADPGIPAAPVVGTPRFTG
jgi:hypothetical protein